MRVLIDGDGCPVVDIAINIAKELSIECIIICDTSHHINREGATTITVSKGADSADFAIVNMINSGDVIVTQDYGLSAMALARKGKPITQNGLIINDFNIDTLLNQRAIAKKIRNAGGRLKGPSKRTEEQNKQFEISFRKLLNNI